MKRLQVILWSALQGSQGAASRLAKAVIENPLGSPIKNTSDGLCSSDPSSLDVLFFSALSKSPLREKNLTEADIVLVPFWVHKLVKLDKELEKPNRSAVAVLQGLCARKYSRRYALKKFELNSCGTCIG